METPVQPKINVGVLGATGTVGQRFITLLATHPWFNVHSLGASSRSAGQEYAKVTKWKQADVIPSAVKAMVVKACKPEEFAGCDVIFSGLDSDVAGDIESAFRSAEFRVFSNAKNYRRDPLVPLVVPLVNTSHLSILPNQQSAQSPPLSQGFIVTNANCSTTGLVVPLYALEKAFGPLECVMVSTLQAISGAGYPGVPSLDILDNVVPYISGEEEKMEWETLKILSALDSETGEFDMHAQSPLRVSATCTRVPVIDGHTMSVSVRFAQRPPPSLAQIREAMADFAPEDAELAARCPSFPSKSIVVHEAPDRPQPRLDRNLSNGATISVGRVRECQVLDVKFVGLVNNTSLGAATSSIMNAEVCVLKGIVKANS